MQNENLTSDGLTAGDKSFTTSTSPHFSGNPFLSPTFRDQIEYSTDFNTSYFPPNSSSLSFSPSDSSVEGEATNAIATENRLYEARFILEYQQLYNRYALCLAHLQKSLKEVDALRQENDTLRLANTDLVRRLSLLSQATIKNCLLSSGHQPLSIVNDFNRLNIGDESRGSRAVVETSKHISPTRVIENNNQFERRNPESVPLPKSISVRSSGYLKMIQNAANNRGPSRPRVTSSSSLSSQRVHVPGVKKQAEALEFDVYNQGMFKTELCNKWQETGECPYGDQCRFAHGITELRPVIRHPRYKTEVCRMVLAGDICPYGHRCHFRHSLTDQERLFRTLF
ncbi:unnamed protein product [Ilex paraguariensis]|uniref:C3H1-type domain-containing protein n=1 Tax=Ilex paraguariensis TaxID=185542 RepID=A0ABC8S0A6_9AQUA